ncbi:MAG: glycosyltransferase family 2 protein [Pseudomonadota bacterium]
MRDLTRVTVAFNSADALRWQARTGPAMRTLVVDNASADQTVTVARRLGYDVLSMPVNQGFGRGVMAGLRAVETDLALVINPDAVMSKTSIAALLTAAERHPGGDLFVPKLVDREGEVFFRHESSLEPRQEPRDIPSGPACIPMISGAVMLVRVRTFLAFGGFDPAIFLYFEDDDLALRYRAARRPIVFVPEAEALHLGDQSSENEGSANRIKDVSFGWSRAYLMAKHKRGSRGLVLAGMLAKLPVYAFGLRFQRVRRQIGRIRGFLRALDGQPAPYLPEFKSQNLDASATAEPSRLT